MIKITWFGTATILIELNGEKLLFDPFFRMNKKLEQPALQEFCNVDCMFNTHAHFDHTYNLPTILEHSTAKLYAPYATYKILKTLNVNVEDKVKVLKPNDILKTKNGTITVFSSKHVQSNLFHAMLVALKSIFIFKARRACKLLRIHKNYPMGNEIFAYEIKLENKKIIVFGSAGIDATKELPKDVDILIWPFQGKMNMTKYSIPIIEKIKPKIIILDHFDNAYPPITSNVNTKKLVKILGKKHPEIKVIVPQYHKTIKLGIN